MGKFGIGLGNLLFFARMCQFAGKHRLSITFMVFTVALAIIASKVLLQSTGEKVLPNILLRGKWEGRNIIIKYRLMKNTHHHLNVLLNLNSDNIVIVVKGSISKRGL